MTLLLQARGLQFTLKAGVHIGPIDLVLAEGAMLGIVGETGSGKSLLCRALTGGLDEVDGRIVSGSLVLNGTDVTTADPATWSSIRRSEIGYVPQASLASLNPVRRVRSQIYETLRITGTRDRPALETQALELLGQVRLDDSARVLRSFPHQLSGGMRQRVMLALALAGDPRLLIADEPTTALDARVQAQILALIRDIQQTRKMGVLLVSHDLRALRRTCDEIAVMHQGRLVERGTTAQVLGSPTHPYTRTLVAAEPSLIPRGKPLLATNTPPRAVREESHAQPRDRRILLEARGVTVSFGAAMPAVADLSVKIRAGDALGIVGESGSGKSTLGWVLAGLLAPTDGEALVQGQRWSPSVERGSVRRSVQVVFQDPYASLNPYQTPLATVAEAVRAGGRISGRDAALRARLLLQRVGLNESVIGRRPNTLSGGQRQRVVIARALACDPEVIIADEPTSALDVSVQAQVVNLLLDLRAERDIALVLISHDLAVVRHLVDNLMVLHEGRLVESGPVDVVFGSPQHPYTAELLRAHELGAEST